MVGSDNLLDQMKHFRWAGHSGNLALQTAGAITLCIPSGDHERHALSPTHVHNRQAFHRPARAGDRLVKAVPRGGDEERRVRV
jgi:hypothetical protein